MADIKIEIAGIRLENPTMLASGILGQTGQSLLRIIHEGGAGAVVTKSIGLEPRTGHGNPCAIELKNGLLNAMGLPNPGIDAFGSELKIALKSNAPVIASIFADTGEKFSTLASRMEEHGAHAVELNLSCPHAEKYGLDMGSDPLKVSDIVGQVKDSVKIPVFAKLSPMVPDIGHIALAVQEAGGDAVVAINTIKAMRIEPEIGMPVLKNNVGGISGPAIKPAGIRAVYEIAGKVDIPIIGVGGVTTGLDAIEYIMAGASAVQIGSGVHYRGIDVFQKVSQEISEFMDRKGYASLQDIIGIARD
ncbi:MAG: dihydroorotate dehydrogenase [Thermoplasmata archaeon]|nr:dihydroorotate dehydrogenase [Thermoplasmata archaeon]